MPHPKTNISYVNPEPLWERTGALSRAGQVLIRSLNALVDRLGGVTGASFPLRDYTVTTLPDAAANTYGIIIVSNETGGATVAFSDGTNWRRVQDRAIVS